MTMSSRSTKPRRAPYRRSRSRHQPRVEALEERLTLSAGTATPAFASHFTHPAAVGEMNPGTVTPAAAVAENNGGVLISPNSKAYGKTMAEWSTTYFRWYFSQTTPGADRANSMVGRVQLMPLPVGNEVIQSGGPGTPVDPAVYTGKTEITLSPGTPFVLPLGVWIGERYEGYPGVPDDKPIDNDVFLAGVQPTLTIDGKTVLSDANKADFYVPPTPFDPIVVYPTPTSYHSVAAVSFQGYAIMGAPLTPGVHTIHLYEPYIIPADAYSGLPDGLGVIYDNTWTITVTGQMPQDPDQFTSRTP